MEFLMFDQQFDWAVERAHDEELEVSVCRYRTEYDTVSILECEIHLYRWVVYLSFTTTNQKGERSEQDFTVDDGPVSGISGDG
jgi:hypothetical protein